MSAKFSKCHGWQLAFGFKMPSSKTIDYVVKVEAGQEVAEQ